MELKFKTFEKQRIALRYLRDNKTNEVLYGGGARGGKSYLGCGWVIMECLQKPGSAWLIAREELTKLRDTTLITFFKAVKDLDIKQRIGFNAQSLIVTFNNGSIIFFREIKYIPSDPEFDRLGSYDLTGCFLDECQQIHEKAISVLRGRFSVLSGDGWKTIPKSLYTCNPSKNWIYSSFIRPSREGNLSDDKVFIKSLATDNPFVSEDYINNLKKSDKVTVKRLLEGDFDYDDDPATLIEYEKILDCFTNNFDTLRGEKYITADIARLGSDKVVIGLWDGSRVKIESFGKERLNTTGKIIEDLRIKHGIPKSHVLCDEDGVGGGIIDFMNYKGFVNNSSPLVNTVTLQPENFSNLKSQCYFKLAERINRGGLFISTSDIKIKADIIQELEQVKQFNMDKDGKKQILPKDKVKEAIGRSPDYADMLMMREWFDLKPAYKVAVF